MAFLRDKHPSPNEPTRWDLADLRPQFAKRIDDVAALRVVYDQFTDGMLGFLEDEKAALKELNANPDAKGLLKWAEDHMTLQTEWSRTSTFVNLYRNEFFKNDAAQEFARHASDRLSEVNHQCIEAWREMALTPDKIAELIAEEPKLEKFKTMLAPTKKAQTVFETDAEKRAKAEAIDTRLVDPQYLYKLLNSSNSTDTHAKAATATQMFNAKIHQEWEAAKKDGTTPLGGYGKRNNISEDFLESYIRELPELRREMLDSLRKSTTSDAKIPPISWAEATDVVVKALTDFHPEMGEIAKMAIEENWIHAAPSAEKFHNGFANGSAKQTTHPANHPYILMDFDGSPRSVKTLGHEIGHAIVQFLEADRQVLSDGTTIQTTGEPAVEIKDGKHVPIEGKFKEVEPQKALDSGALHETFAHFSETLAMDELMRRQTDPEIKASLAHTRRTQYQHTVTGAGFNEFEDRLYQLGKSHFAKPFPKAQIARAWRNTVGANVNATDEDVVLRAGRVTHFINYKPHYYMSYALAEIGAQTLTDKLEQASPVEKKALAEQWVGIMREAPKHTYGSAMKEMGIELTTPQEALAPIKRRFYGMAEKAAVAPEAAASPTEQPQEQPEKVSFAARIKAKLAAEQSTPRHRA